MDPVNPSGPIKFSKKCLAAKLAAELCALLIFAVITEIVVRLYKPTKIGFWCNDLSIREHEVTNTLSSRVLFFVMYIVPPVTIAIIEGILMILDKKSVIYTKFEYGHKNVVKYAIRFCYSYWYYLAAFIPVYEITMLVKTFASRLRPSFITVCRPNVDVDWCIDQPVYISNYTCTGSSEFLIGEQYYSFWSGHAALTATTSTFIAMYIHARLREVIGVKSLLLVLQTGVMAFAVVAAITRYTDHMHHASDVATGFVVGILVPFFNLSKLGFLDVRQKDIAHSELDNKIEIMIAKAVTKMSSQVKEKSPVPSYSSGSA